MEMELNMTMVYWKSVKFWLGKLIEHPEIMTQGETLEELEKCGCTLLRHGDRHL